jgi:hypothetical protein
MFQLLAYVFQLLAYVSVTEGFGKPAVLFVEVMFPDPIALLHATHQNRRDCNTR